MCHSRNCSVCSLCVYRIIFTDYSQGCTCLCKYLPAEQILPQNGVILTFVRSIQLMFIDEPEDIQQSGQRRSRHRTGIQKNRNRNLVRRT